MLLQTRQPWADIVAEPARPTAEQEEWLKAEGFREEPAEEEPDQDAEDGPPKVIHLPTPWASLSQETPAPHCSFDEPDFCCKALKVKGIGWYLAIALRSFLGQREGFCKPSCGRHSSEDACIQAQLTP